MMRAALLVCGVIAVAGLLAHGTATPVRSEGAPGGRVMPVPKPGGGASAERAPRLRLGLPQFGRGSADPKKARLLAAYPGAFAIEGNTVVFPSGERIVWDDGRDKTAAELLTNADVEDMFAYPYPTAAAGPVEPPRAHDPGRVRSQAFFKALYGSSAGAVRQSVRTVPWLPSLGGGSLAVTTRFGIDRKIERISAELERLPARFHGYLKPPAGAFLWRQIAGTNRLSVHSFGAAVDIATANANYWRWDGAPAGGPFPYRNQIPLEIVDVFEAHCFIWGGRWYHYDTMHFEYRPELLPRCER